MRRLRLFISLALASMAVNSLASGESPADPRPNDSMIGLKPPEGAVVLFDGKNLDAWVNRSGKGRAEWPIDDGVLTVGKGNIMTAKPFGDFQLHLEFNVPYMPKAHGQARGNSGVYLSGIYELQVLDSYGLKLHADDCGAIYKQVIPSVNACKPPLQWQTYDVTFHKAQLENGKVVKKARVTVVQNGIKTIDDVEISPCPAGADNKEGEAGPLLLQDHGNPVQFRNIWIKPLD